MKNILLLISDENFRMFLGEALNKYGQIFLWRTIEFALKEIEKIPSLNLVIIDSQENYEKISGLIKKIREKFPDVLILADNFIFNDAQKGTPAAWFICRDSLLKLLAKILIQ